MNSPPLITVLMPVFNGEKYLGEAIKSILGQTFTDFEFLIINDGSTDNTGSIINSFSDPRIRLVNNSKNLGVIKSLNIGLRLAKGNYIARMDADDISLPTRLEQQQKFMLVNKDIGLCGSFLQILGANGEIWKPPISDGAIRSALLFESVIYHPTSFFRLDLFRKNNLFYDENFPCAEDYELWTRCLDYMKVANMDKVLLLRRVHANSVSRKRSHRQQEVAGWIRLRLLNRLGITPNNDEMALHNKIALRCFSKNKEFIRLSDRWLKKLLEANHKVRIFPQNDFFQCLAQRWLDICCFASNSCGLSVWKAYCTSPLGEKYHLPLSKIRLLLKCSLALLPKRKTLRCL